MDFYTKPEYITKWNQASDDWHTPHAESDLRPQGRFLSRMEAKDGSAGFDFTGTFEEVEKNKLISYVMDDGRKARVEFNSNGTSSEITVTFDAEETNPVEMQRQGWQAILDNFKKFVQA